LDDPINRYDQAMLERLSELIKSHPRTIKMQPVFTKLDKLVARRASKKLIKARDTLYNMAPDALEPWYLVRAGGKLAGWVGIKEMQTAAILGAGLSVLKPVKKTAR
jgi:GTP-binding protein EngB required for normal cell division